MLIIAAGCGVPGRIARKPQYAVQVSQEMQAEFKLADRYYRRKIFQKALLLFAEFVDSYPYNKLTDQALLRMGQIHLHIGQPQEAVSKLRGAVRGVYDVEITPEILYTLMLAYQRAGELGKAWDVLKRVHWAATRAKGRLKIASFGIRVGKESNRSIDEIIPLYLEIIDAYVILTSAPRPAPSWLVGRSDALLWVRRWVDASETSVGFMRKLAKRFEGKTAGGYVIYKLAKQAYADGQTELAREYYDKYVHGYPKHEYVDEARIRLTELGRKVDTDYVSIGVVLPFTGRYGRYGKAVMRGIECGAGILDPCEYDQPIRLVIRDTASDPARASEAFQEVIGSEYVAAVIGPLAQVEVASVARQSEIHEVPTITLSQKKDVTESGRYVFRNFLTIEDQVQTLVRHVCSTEDRNIAVLYPNSRGGRMYKDLFEKGIKECGGSLAAVKSYQPSGGNFQDAIRGLKFSVSRHGLGGSLGFDALFVPDSYKNLSRIFPLLSFLNVKDVRLYGTAGWNNKKLVEEFPEIMEGSVFVGGFFSDSQASPTRRFAKTYAQAYGNNPSFLEAYGYDSLQLVKRAVRNRRSAKRPEIREALANIRGFPGSTGAITIDRFGDAKRRLFLLTVDQGHIRELN